MANKKQQKLYVIRKYVKAPDIKTAIRMEKNQTPDDVWLDDKFKDQLASAIGFIQEIDEE